MMTLLTQSAFSRPATLKKHFLNELYTKKITTEETQVKEISKIHAEGSDNVFAAQWHGHFDLEIPQCPSDHSLLVLHISGGRVQGRNNRFGNFDYAPPGPGSVTFHPQDCPIYWRSEEGAVDFMHFYVPTADIAAQSDVRFGKPDAADNLEVSFSTDKALIQSLQALRQAAKAGPMNELELMGWNNMIVGQILRVFAQDIGSSAPTDAKPLTQELLFKVQDLIEDRIEEKITLDELAAIAGWDVYRFTRAFRNTVGQTPHQYVLARRIDRVSAALRASSDALADIAFACGFSSQQHMTNAFTKHVGVSPAKYRAEVMK